MAVSAELQNTSEDTVKLARGVSFPTLSLPESVSIITKAAQYGRQQTVAAIAGYAGHATANSGPFKQKLAALKEWGLITVAGGAVTITDIGMRIALPTAAETALDLQIKAFQGCAIFWKLYNDSAKGVSLKMETLGNVAVTTHGVAVKSKERFVRSFADSAAAVGLAELSGSEITLVGAGSTTPVLSTPADDNLQANSHNEVDEVQISTAPVRSGIPVVIHQEWGGGQAEIVFEIRSSNPLPSAAFMSISETVTSIESLWDALRQHSEGGSDGATAQ